MGNTVCFTASQRSLEEYAYAWAQVSLAHSHILSVQPGGFQLEFF